MIPVRNILARLNEYALSGKMVKIKRKIAYREYIYGFVQDYSEQLIVLLHFHGFYCQGYSIIRLSDVLEIILTEHEEVY